MSMKILSRNGNWENTWVTPETLAGDMAKNPNLAVLCRALSFDEFKDLRKEFRKHDIVCYCVPIGNLVFAYASMLRKRKSSYTKKYLYAISRSFKECPTDWIRE